MAPNLSSIDIWKVGDANLRIAIPLEHQIDRLRQLRSVFLIYTARINPQPLDRAHILTNILCEVLHLFTTILIFVMSFSNLLICYLLFLPSMRRNCVWGSLVLARLREFEAVDVE